MPEPVLDERRLRRLLNADLAFERGDEPARMAPELESTVYRLVQEALTNAVRHAGRRG
jgi:signal transduction histidine kinase